MQTATQRRWQLIVALTVFGVTPAVSQQPTPPATSFTGSTVLTISVDSIRSYADLLTFDRTPGAADRQLVDFKKGRIGTGDSARIEPEQGSYLLQLTDLAQGRIIARIWSAVANDSLGIGKGYTWWWVDHSGAGGKWRSVFIPQDTTTAKRRAWGLRFEDDPHYWRQAIARFRFGSPPFWATCGSRCCLS